MAVDKDRGERTREVWQGIRKIIQQRRERKRSERDMKGGEMRRKKEEWE